MALFGLSLNPIDWITDAAGEIVDGAAGAFIDVVVDWVEELGVTRVLGADENVLGLRGWDDDHVLVFEGLLRGMGEREIEAPLKSRVSEIAGKLRGATLFRATF